MNRKTPDTRLSEIGDNPQTENRQRIESALRRSSAERPYFVQQNELRHYEIQGLSLDIEVTPSVFPPPENNPISSKHFTVNKGESVIDIGTGSGILAILAAKLGGIVSATDIDENAVELARRNAVRNNTEINCLQGEYFGGLPDKFDVIIANLSQTSLPPDLRGASQIFRSVDGGNNGNEILLQLLDEAKEHMHEASRLYVNIFTLSDYQSTLNKIKKEYEARLIAKQTEPVKEFIEENIEWYRQLAEEGKIKLFFDRVKKRWLAEQYFYELRLK